MKFARLILLVGLLFIPLVFISSARAHPADASSLLATPTPHPTATPWPTLTPVPLRVAAVTLAPLAVGTPLAAPELLEPAQDSIPNIIRPLFDWTDVSGATAYTITVSRYSSFAYPLVKTTVKVSNYTPIADLPRSALLYWRVQVTGPGLGLYAAASFTSPNPPYPPTLLKPGSKALLSTYTPLLDWSASKVPSDAAFDYYLLQVDDNSDFSSPVLEFTEPRYSYHDYQVAEPLVPNTTFYWRVRAANVFGQYSLWQASSFRTAMPPPVLVYPGYLETPNNLRPVFDWEDVPGATGYGLVVSTHANFSSPVISVSVKNSYYQPTVDLPWNKVLFWRVRAKGANLGNWGSSNFASPHPPQKVSPFTPAAGAVVSRMPTLTWTKAYIAPGIEFGYYLLQVDDDSDFSSPLIEYIETNINQRTYKITETEALLPGSRYYWRIRAANSVGHFSTWKSRSFKTSGVRVTATPTPTPTATPPAPLTLLYENLPNGFSFYYPEDATLVFDGGANFARIRLTYAPGTNLHDKNLEVSAWDASQPCESPVPGIETARRTEIINGLSFLVQEGEDHGLGNIYNWVGYSTLQGNVCANLLFVLHSTAPGNY